MKLYLYKHARVSYDCLLLLCMPSQQLSLLLALRCDPLFQASLDARLLSPSLRCAPQLFLCCFFGSTKQSRLPIQQRFFRLAVSSAQDIHANADGNVAPTMTFQQVEMDVASIAWPCAPFLHQDVALLLGCMLLQQAQVIARLIEHIAECFHLHRYHVAGQAFCTSVT